MVRKKVERAVKETFPKAQETKAFGMEGWTIPRPKGAPVPERAGTMPTDRVMVFLAERANGTSLHVWYPGQYDLLGKRKDELGEAGFKVMRACLQYTRKQEYPIEAVSSLLKEIRRQDAAKAPR